MYVEQDRRRDALKTRIEFLHAESTHLSYETAAGSTLAGLLASMVRLQGVAGNGVEGQCLFRRPL